MKNNKLERVGKIFLQLLPGFIPLFIFIAADEIWGTKIGLIVAIIVGFAELLFYWLKDKKIDKFILFDTGLIVVLGIISILLDNEVFFKIKPALIGLLTSAILAISAFTPSNLLTNMLKRYMRGMEVNAEQLKMMKKSTKNMFYIFMLYTILVFYSVWFMSTKAWAFVSGGLFYIIIGVYFIYELIKNKILRKNISAKKWLPIVNEKGEIIAKAPYEVCHSNKKYMHPVVHLHIIDDKKQLLLKKYSDSEKNAPKWGIAVKGHVEYGENIETRLFTQAEKDIKISDFRPKMINKYIEKFDNETEYIFSFIAEYDNDSLIRKNEHMNVEFWDVNEIEKKLRSGIFSPKFVVEFEKNRKFLLSKK